MIDLFTTYGPALWQGFLVTLQFSLGSFAIACVIGLVIAAMRVSPVAPLQRFAMGYVAFFRNTPIIALLFLAYFGTPYLGVPTVDSLATGMITLGLYTGAYMAETIRSGINSVSKGQAEAARAIGLPFRQTLTTIVMPQALRSVIPPVNNLFIANAKNTAVAIGIGVVDITSVSYEIVNSGAPAVQLISLAALFYVVYLLLASAFFGWLEKRMAISR